MASQELQEFIDRYRRAVNIELTRFTSDFYQVQELEEAVSNALWGGKRLRPILVLMSAAAIDPAVDLDRLVPISCAVEMIHIFTLVHDDLPGMDDAELRHGQACTHIKYGEGVAILTGDALLNQAFAVVRSTPLPGLSDKRRLNIIGHLSKACATVVEGQVCDLAYAGKDISIEELEGLHRSKTAALLEACCHTGVELAGGDSDDLERLTEFATHFGLAYQIKDDILSVTGDEAEVGKTLATDTEAEKATYPRLLGLDKSVELLNETTERAALSVSYYGKAGKLLADLAFWCRDRTR
ncbi:polyprenyl synthetase family protein [bacterium]|nr:polyprenyl synthetase family protein [bacterium]